MLAAIDAILNLFSKRERDVDVIDEAIKNLHQSDDEIERRLRTLRTQVDVYQRTNNPEDASDDG
jgi:Mg2+ and Co2+ transporter CorA